MRILKDIFVLALVLAVVLLPGCGPEQQPTPFLSLVPQPAPFDSVLSDATPMPHATLPVPVPGQAAVEGQIRDSRTQQAPLEGVVYLGQVLSLDNGKPVVRLDREVDPFAVPDSSGRFVFPEVEPGEYGLILYTPEATFLVDREDGSSMLFVVEPGKVLDIGIIEVPMP
jgi:hypothetical protein